MGLSKGHIWQNPNLFFSITISNFGQGNILNPTILPKEKLISKRKDFPGMLSNKEREYSILSVLWNLQRKQYWKATLAIICDNIKKIILQFWVGKWLEFDICDQYLSISWCSFITRGKIKPNNKLTNPLWIKSRGV